MQIISRLALSAGLMFRARMRRPTTVLLVSLLVSSFSMAVASAAPEEWGSEEAVFKEFNEVCRKSQQLWGKSSCGPLMLVDPASRRVIASAPDEGGTFRPLRNGMYAGTLPAGLPLANTAMDFGGKRWAMVLLPLPERAEQKAVLVAHEAFHRIQPDLQLSEANTEGRNGHLDREQGRLLMQLELRALDRALAELARGRDPQNAARDALAFRTERQRLFAKAAVDESALERFEGTAEYTGIMAAGGDLRARVELARDNLRQAPEQQSFTRSFAYATGPAYGLLLDRLMGASWRASLVRGTTLQQLLFMGTRGLGQGSVQSRASIYGGESLAIAERQREIARVRRETELRAKLVDGPVVVLPITGAINFDPRKIVLLEGAGTVYGAFSTSGAWGELTVIGDALVAPDWSQVHVPGPASVDGRVITGADWRLALNPGWSLVAGPKAGQQTITRPASTMR